MKYSLSNPVKYGKKIVLEAILLTAGIHVLFFVLFSVPEISQERDERELSTVTLLRFADENKGSADMQEYILKYSPAHFSSSRSPQGFGSFMQKAGERRIYMEDVSKHDIMLLAAENSIRAAVPSVPERRNVLPRRSFPENKVLSRERIVYPFAVSDSGIVIPITLSTEEQSLAQEFPLNCGVYKLFIDKKHNIKPRLVLLQSCGRRSFDNLSIKQLYQAISKLSECSDGEIVTVHYREHDAVGGGI